MVYTLFIGYLWINKKHLQTIVYLSSSTNRVLLLKVIIYFLQQGYSNMTMWKKDVNLLNYASSWMQINQYILILLLLM